MNDKKPLDYFKLERPHQFEAAEELLEKMFYFDGDQRKIRNKYVSLWASLKWGKREVLDIMSPMSPDVHYIYLSPPWTDLQDQRLELSDYGWHIDSRKGDIIKNPNPNDIYVIAFDEADWGDGKGQQFANRFDKVKDLPNVILMGISATNFTFVYNLEKFLFQNCVIGKPYDIYESLGKFPTIIIDEKAIDKEGNISRVCEKILREWLRATNNSLKIKFVIRETQFKERLIPKIKALIEQWCFEECGDRRIEVTLVDQYAKYNWKKQNDDAWINSGRQLFIVKQTFTRGTETDIQKFLYGYYDYRGKQTALNTIAQALGRFPNYKGVSDIKLFISEEHQKYLDAYLKIEKEILSGKSLLSILSDYKDVIYTSKFKEVSGSTASKVKRQWCFAWDKPILRTFTQKIKDLDKYDTFDSKIQPSTRERIYQGLINNQTTNGRWDKRNHTKTHVVFYPDLVGFANLDRDQKQFLIDKGVWKHLENGSVVVIEATPIGVTLPKTNGVSSKITDVSAFSQIMN